MTSTEIHYILPELSRNEENFEAILAAMGAYQDDTLWRIPQTVEVAESRDVVMMKLIRQRPYEITHYQAERDVEVMREGVEGHFPDDKRHYLAHYFAGVAIKGVFAQE